MATFIRYFAVLVEAVVSLLLIGVILMQRTKSQGLGMALGGQMGEALFGARMGNVLTRTTVVLGIIFLLNTTFLAYLGAGSRRVSVTDSVVPAVPAAPAAVPSSGVDSVLPGDVSGQPIPMDSGAATAPVEVDPSGAIAPAESVSVEPTPVPMTAPVPAAPAPVTAE